MAMQGVGPSSSHIQLATGRDYTTSRERDATSGKARTQFDEFEALAENWNEPFSGNAEISDPQLGDLSRYDSDISPAETGRSRETQESVSSQEDSPRISTSSNKVQIKVGDQQFTESERAAPSHLISLQYYKLRGGSDPEKIAYLQSDQVRRSPQKEIEQTMAGLTNGVIHTISNEAGESEFVMRSGASSAYHSNEPICSECQAIGKVLVGVGEWAKNAKEVNDARDTGEILYIEQSLLSDTGKEADMISQSQAAFDKVGDVKVHLFNQLPEGVTYMEGVLKPGQSAEDAFKEGLPCLQKNEDGRIIAYVYSPNGQNKIDKLNPEGLSITTVFKNNGINEKAKKSWGNDFEKNKATNKKLIEVADRKIKRLESKIESLEKELQAQGPGSDISLISSLKIAKLRDQLQVLRTARDRFNQYNTKLIGPHGNKQSNFTEMKMTQEFIVALGGIVGIMCKSGKDRTSMFAIFCLSHIANLKGWFGINQNKAEKLEGEMREEIKLNGVSPKIVKRNNNMATYAINLFQSYFFPQELKPPSERRQYVWASSKNT